MFDSIKTKIFDMKIKGRIKAFKDGFCHPKKGSLECTNYSLKEWNCAMAGRVTARFLLYFTPAAAVMFFAGKFGILEKLGRTTIKRTNVWTHSMIDTYQEIWDIPNKLLKLKK